MRETAVLDNPKTLSALPMPAKKTMPNPPSRSLHSHDFDVAVRGLYHAATYATAWEPVLDVLCRSLSARALTLQIMIRPDNVWLGLQHGDDDLAECAIRYLRQWSSTDEKRDTFARRETGTGSTICNTWMHRSDWSTALIHKHQTCDHHHWSGSPGKHATHLALFSETSQITAFAIAWQRPRIPLKAEERGLVERLGRHMRDALQTHDSLSRIQPPATVGKHLLQSLPRPSWLLGECASVQFANSAAQEEQMRGRRVRVSGGQLQLQPPGDQAELEREVAGLLRSSKPARRVMNLCMPLPASNPARTHLLLQRLSAQSETKKPTLPATGVIVLATLFDLARDCTIDARALSEVFGFTQAEGRVACLVVQGLSAADMASRLGVKQTTVRTHVRQVLAKLGVHRKANAIRVLSRGAAMRPSNGQPTASLTRETGTTR